MYDSKHRTMKKIMIYSLLAATLLFSACDDLLEDVKFNVSLDSANTYVAGEPVTFHFEGNPNFITFFSGEDGNRYDHRNRTEIDPAEIQSTRLSFQVRLQYGSDPAQFHVYLSDHFNGLSGEAQADSLKLMEHDWTDITEQCFPEGSLDKNGNGQVNVDMDISDYRNNFILAFRHNGAAGATQKRADISGLHITNNLQTKSIEAANASTLNFRTFDMLPSHASGDPYIMPASGNGTWILKDISSNTFYINGGNAQAPANDDWLVSTPMKLNQCSPDNGVVLKDINRRITSYTHTYQEPGTYDVYFFAGNTNIDGTSEILRKLTVTITATE